MTEFDRVCPKCQGKGLGGPQPASIRPEPPPVVTGPPATPPVSAPPRTPKYYDLHHVNPKWAASALFGTALIIAFCFLRISDWKPFQPAPPPGPVFDVSRARGLEIGVVGSVFGKATEYYFPSTRDIGAGVEEGSSGWTKEQFHMTVKFNIRSDKVNYFQLDSTDKSRPSSDLKPLLDAVGLKQDDPNFTIEPLPAGGDSGGYSGLKLTPKFK